MAKANIEVVIAQIEVLRKATSLSRISDSDYALLLQEVRRVGVSEVRGVLGDRLRSALGEVMQMQKHLPGKHDQRAHAGRGGALPLHPGPALEGDQLKALQKDSAAAHLVPDGAGGYRFSDERQALHDRIVADAVAGVPPSADPTYTLMGGGPAAGKSTVLDNPQLGLPGKGDAVVVDSDAIKGSLPEYRDMVAAGDIGAAAFAHEESSYLAKRVQLTAFGNRQNVLLDGTGDESATNVRKKISTARANGYKVTGEYVTADTDASVARAKTRAARTGRMPPEPFIRNTHASVSRIVPEVAGDFDSIRVWDTNGSGAKLIAQGSLGKTLTVLDAPAFSAFLAKGTVPRVP